MTRRFRWFILLALAQKRDGRTWSWRETWILAGKLKHLTFEQAVVMEELGDFAC